MMGGRKLEHKQKHKRTLVLLAGELTKYQPGQGGKGGKSGKLEGRGVQITEPNWPRVNRVESSQVVALKSPRPPSSGKVRLRATPRECSSYSSSSLSSECACSLQVFPLRVPPLLPSNLTHAQS